MPYCASREPVSARKPAVIGAGLFFTMGFSAQNLTVFERLAVMALFAVCLACPASAESAMPATADPRAVDSISEFSGATVNAGTETKSTAGAATAPVSSAASQNQASAPATSSKTESSNGGTGARRILRPYGWVLKKIKKAVPGDVVKVRLTERANDLWTYDVTVLNDAGRYVQLSLNASTGAIISRKSR